MPQVQVHPQGGQARKNYKQSHPAGGIVFCEGEKIIGHIAEKPSPRRIEGYPYRALFIVDKFNKGTSTNKSSLESTKKIEE